MVAMDMAQVMTALQDQGYVLLKGILSAAQVQTAQACISDTKPYTVDYTSMTAFIRQHMLPAVNSTMNGSGFNTAARLQGYQPFDLQVMKYRVSDNNNSADASTFHRDVVNHAGWQPYMTCLTYLDPTVMEVIPRSHRIPHYSWADAYTAFGQRQEVAVAQGDVLLFYSSLLHRGIFTASTASNPRRRLVQLFDCVRDVTQATNLFPLILHIPSPPTTATRPTLILDSNQSAPSRSNTLASPAAMTATPRPSVMITLSRIKWLITILNIFGFCNAARGYGGWVPPAPWPPNVSSEGMQGRVEVVPQTWQPSNQYVLLRPTVDWPLADHAAFHYASYTRQFIIYGGVALLLLLTLLALLAGGLTGLIKLGQHFFQH